MTIKAGESLTTQMIIQNSGPVHAGTYRTVVSVVGPEGTERRRSTITGKLSPAVALASVNPAIDGGTVKQGSISVIGQFAIEGNTNRVQIQVAATDLYLNDDPNGHITLPIPLDQAVGLNVTSIHGSINSGRIPWQSKNSVVIGNETAISTDPFGLTAPDVNAPGISDNLFFTISWLQDDKSKPPGTYTGHVRVTALVLPDQ